MSAHYQNTDWVGARVAPVQDNHGADIRLDKNIFAGISHVTRDGGYSKPTVRSYSDGIRVGCTFVTNEAIELIYSWHQEFLKNGNSKVHQ